MKECKERNAPPPKNKCIDLDLWAAPQGTTSPLEECLLCQMVSPTPQLSSCSCSVFLLGKPQQLHTYLARGVGCYQQLLCAAGTRRIYSVSFRDKRSSCLLLGPWMAAGWNSLLPSLWLLVTPRGETFGCFLFYISYLGNIHFDLLSIPHLTWVLTMSCLLLWMHAKLQIRDLLE